MNEQENIQLVKQCYQDFMKGDIGHLLSQCAQDINWELPAIESVPHSGMRHGLDKVGEFFRQLDELQSCEQFEPKEFIAQGDKVIALGHYAWTIKSTGARYESDWTHVFTIRDGKLAGFREFADSHLAEHAYSPERSGMALGGMQQSQMSRPDAMH